MYILFEYEIMNNYNLEYLNIQSTPSISKSKGTVLSIRYNRISL